MLEKNETGTQGKLQQYFLFVLICTVNTYKVSEVCKKKKNEPNTEHFYENVLLLWC